MHICPICNTAVPHPVNRKCPNGHGLFEGLVLGTTEEKSAAASFLSALLWCLGVTVAVASINGLWPASPLHDKLVWFFIFYVAFGVLAILRGLKWRRAGGPVARLAPRAFGTGAGAIATTLLLLGVGFFNILR
jgi:hypothetical protein